MVVLHVAVSVALLAGASVLVLRKGTALHRRLGWLYAASASVMAFSSFGIYEIRDGPSLFHAISVVVLVLVGFAVYQPLRRPRSSTWMSRHLVLMQTSYLMLVVTGIAQFFDQLPFESPAINAIVFLQLPLVMGIALISASARAHLKTPLSRHG
ncbi:hypothetical protein LJ756_13310 [Arthrobacter sp. zg-Y411]|uniref:hypothetical protein n=1 Tax=Arthrobacter zhangbolii TaxID=2886936 RepID=UPI001D15DA57|nr:hypothetical protein [Arthrobacter zhangbolii]MCC3295597.1 hypothetical protein [Arthrobacter zhangbolii]